MIHVNSLLSLPVARALPHILRVLKESRIVADSIVILSVLAWLLTGKRILRGTGLVKGGSLILNVACWGLPVK